MTTSPVVTPERVTARDAIMTALRTCQKCSAVVPEDRRKCESCGTTLKPRGVREIVEEALSMRPDSHGNPAGVLRSRLWWLVRGGDVVKTGPATYALPKVTKTKEAAL